MISAIFKFVVPFGLVALGLFQTLYYRRLKSVFSELPVVAGEIIESKLHDDPWTNPGKRVFEARIKYKYRFRGKEYIGDTPALRGYQLWPSYSYEYELLKRYKKGDIANIKVVPSNPRIAYLEVAPLDKKSAMLMPILAVGYLAFLFGYIYFIAGTVNA